MQKSLRVELDNCFCKLDKATHF